MNATPNKNSPLSSRGTNLSNYYPTFGNPSGARSSTGNPENLGNQSKSDLNNVWSTAFSTAKVQAAEQQHHVNISMGGLFPHTDKFSVSTPLTEIAVVTNQVLKTDKRGEINKLYDTNGIGTFANDIERLVETKTLPEQTHGAISATEWRMTSVTHRIQSLDYNNTTTGGQILYMLPEALRGMEKEARGIFDYYCAHAKYQRETSPQDGEDARTASTFKTVTKKKKKKKGSSSPAEEEEAKSPTKRPAEDGVTDEETLAAPAPIDIPENWRLTECAKRITFETVQEMYNDLQTTQERDSWFYKNIAEGILTSAGCNPKDFEFEVTGRALWETAGNMVYGAIRQIILLEERLMDEDERCSDQAKHLEKEAIILLQNDLLIMLGGPATIQAAYSNTIKFLLHYLNENETKEIQDYFMAMTNLTPANGSIIGALFGVIEFGREITGVIKTAVTGEGTTNNAIREAVTVLKELKMERTIR